MILLNFAFCSIIYLCLLYVYMPLVTLRDTVFYIPWLLDEIPLQLTLWILKMKWTEMREVPWARNIFWCYNKNVPNVSKESVQDSVYSNHCWKFHELWVHWSHTTGLKFLCSTGSSLLPSLAYTHQRTL